MQAEVANRPLYVLHELQHTSASIFAQPSLGGHLQQSKFPNAKVIVGVCSKQCEISHK